MISNKASYRQILSATSIFGGAQVLRIIVGVIRSKFIAVILGPTGMGISGLILATTDMLSSLTNFGLSTSGVRSLSELNSSDDDERLFKKVAVFKRLILLTGILGSVIMLLSARYLSLLTFDETSYKWAFALMSVVILANQISLGQSTILTATRQIKMLAKSTILGSILSLFVTVPLYYLYGNSAIAPAFVLSSLTSLGLSSYYVSKLSLRNVPVNVADLKSEGREMLVMGFLISLTSIISYLISYLIRLFISETGNIEDVGLYNAGFAIVNIYVGMVFTAMSADYYPKLTAMASDRVQLINAINQQAEIAILILGPIIAIFILFIKWLIYILYSEAFLSIDKMIMFAASGMLFKALSWSISFVFLAKSSQKLFFWNELIASAYTFAFSIVGYYYGGLTGLGMSFVASYFLYFVQVFVVARYSYEFIINRELFVILWPNLALTLSCLYVSMVDESSTITIVKILLVLTSFVFNFFNLTKKIDFNFKCSK